MATGRGSSARASVDLTFEELYRGHRADVYRAALRELGNTHDAEDVTQAAFADAYRAVLRGTRPQSPRAWLLAISENVRRRRFRTAQRRPREEFVDDADFPPAAEPPYEQSHALAEALAALPADQRRVFVLRELVGLSYAEIAEETGSTIASIQMLLFRARRSLREQLEPPTVAIRRPAFLPPVPSWLASLFSRVELATLTPRAAGALGATVLTIAGATVAVPVPDAVAREAARSSAAGNAPATAETATAPVATKLTARTVAQRAAPRRIGRTAPEPRPAARSQTAAPLPPSSAPTAAPAPAPIAVPASTPTVLVSDVVETPLELPPLRSLPPVSLPPVSLPPVSLPPVLLPPLPVEPPVPVPEAPPALPDVVGTATGAAGAAGASAPPVPVPLPPLPTLPPAP
jgi:RNA polymerase sigma-70 factor, ECF subfamily